MSDYPWKSLDYLVVIADEWELPIQDVPVDFMTIRTVPYLVYMQTTLKYHVVLLTPKGGQQTFEDWLSSQPGVLAWFRDKR